jgi:hypothetical protein
LQFCVVRGVYVLVDYVMTLSVTQIVCRWMAHVRILFVTCMYTLPSNNERKASQLPTPSRLYRTTWHLNSWSCRMFSEAYVIRAWTVDEAWSITSSHHLPRCLIVGG